MAQGQQGGPSLDDFAKQLAAAKTGYMGANGNAQLQQQYAQQGQAIREQAIGSGLDLSQLENQAQTMATGKGLSGDTQSYGNQNIQKAYNDYYAKNPYTTQQQQPLSPPAGQNTFGLNGLNGYVQAINSAGGGDTPVAQARFQNPQQLGQLITQMNQILQPITDAQKQSLQTQFNGNMQGLDNKWASRGLLASGAAAGAESNAVNSLNQQLQQIQAGQAKDAAGLGLQYGDLGLKESDMIFNQGMANRNFDLSRAKDAAGAYASGLSAQNAENKQNYDQWSNTQQLGIAQQKNAFDQAIQQANMTGKYLPPGAEALIQQAMSNKESWGSADPNTQAKLAAQNQSIYQQLNALGIDSSKIGANVGVQQALQNLGSLGQETLPAWQAQVDANYKQSQLGLQQQTLNLEQQKEQDQINQFNQDMNYKQAALSLQQATQQTDSDYKKFLEDQGISKEQQGKATQGYLTQAIGAASEGYNGAKGAQAAAMYLMDNAPHITQDGADVATILSQIDKLFPGTQSVVSSAAQGGNPFGGTGLPGSATNNAFGGGGGSGFLTP